MTGIVVRSRILIVLTLSCVAASQTEILECELESIGQKWLPAPPDHAALDCGCDLPVIDLSLPDSFETVFSLWDKFPFLLRNASDNGQVRSRTQRSEFLIEFGEYVQGEHFRAIAPDHKAIDTFYLFDSSLIDQSMEFRELITSIKPPHIEGPLGEKLYEANEVSISFGIGPSGSGVQWHVHGPGFSEVYHGRKRWMLYPPEDYHAIEFDPDQTALQWLMGANRSSLFEDSELSPPICCTISPEEVLYFPPMWPHAILNIGDTVFASYFI